MKKVVVTAAGLHLHEKPTRTSPVTDSLTKGDLLAVEEDRRPHTFWLPVRVLRIANARYSNAREGVSGWVWADGTVLDIPDDPKPVPPPPPPPPPAPKPVPVPPPLHKDWAFWGAIAIAVALVAFLVWDAIVNLF